MFGFWSIEFLYACGWVLQYVLKSKNSRAHSFLVGRRRSRKNQGRPAKAEGYWLSDGQPPHGSLSLSLSHSARHCALLYKGQNVTGWRAYKEKVLHSLWPLGRWMIESMMSVEMVLLVMMTWHDMIQHEDDNSPLNSHSKVSAPNFPFSEARQSNGPAVESLYGMFAGQRSYFLAVKA